MITEQQLREFVDEQLQSWSMLHHTYNRMAEQSRKRTLSNGVTILHQPWRVRSSGAKLDAATIARRECFLCKNARPAEQKSLAVNGEYDILVNPYPVYPGHLTIVSNTHKPQKLDHDSITVFAQLAYAWPNSTVFFNGSGCGASAPDHLHFQAIVGFKPQTPLEAMGSHILLQPAEVEQAVEMIKQQLETLKRRGVGQDMVNIASFDGKVLIFPRKALRASNYSADPESEAFMISPATLEMLGLIITPFEKDFTRLNEAILSRIYEETTAGTGHGSIRRTVDVGICSSAVLSFELNGDYTLNGKPIPYGIYQAKRSGDAIRFDNADYTLLHFKAAGSGSTFMVERVTIGIGFHWQRNEDQTFEGDLIVKCNASGELTLINRIGVEDYLKSVVSSEMSANASLEFLKAHAVISRSWLYAQLNPKQRSKPDAEIETHFEESEIVKWYDRDDHSDFDVCADDHCQRYQGIGRIVNNTAIEAVNSTSGLVLLDQRGKIADARFSKCCGGKFETFETCWQPVHFNYLESLTDDKYNTDSPALNTELAARQWITSKPDSFCNCSDKAILSQVLNSYDRENCDFYRWRVEYTRKQLSEIVRRKSGIDFGEITALTPLSRGLSGRIYRLRIEGTKASATVGKELEIRKWLSDTHLRSSAFVVDEVNDPEPRFILTGAGWGHGVGLCQIGAAVMSSRGYDYIQILKHYFPGCNVEKL